MPRVRRIARSSHPRSDLLRPYRPLPPPGPLAVPEGMEIRMLKTVLSIGRSNCWRCRNIGKIMSPTVLKLNQIAQGLLPRELGVSWFMGLSSSDKTSVLRDLAYIATEAHPPAVEVDHAIGVAGLKRSFPR